MIPCLRSHDIVLIVCEVDGESITARWVQINPAKHSSMLGTIIQVIQPKTQNPQRFTVQIPDDIEMVHTDVTFKITTIPVAS